MNSLMLIIIWLHFCLVSVPEEALRRCADTMFLFSAGAHLFRCPLVHFLGAQMVMVPSSPGAHLYRCPPVLQVPSYVHPFSKCPWRGGHLDTCH